MSAFALVPPDAASVARMQAAMQEIWSSSLHVIRGRVDAIDAAARASPSAEDFAARREEGAREAHKLAGIAGSFGFHEASRLAALVEHRLATADGDGTGDAPDLGELAARIRWHLDLDAPYAPERGPEAYRGQHQ